ncbi:SoxR reducing system RseC family protein [Paraglaciecola sp.]|uniref:SoxR reducing system RseC family protein n=1 Tax=Paraglaciecola sp. TaxID=1920173 RepID=UPI0030F42EBB
MIEEMGIVVRIEGEAGTQHIWVETEIKTTCSSCQAQSNCGTSVIAKAFASKKQQLKLAYGQPVEIGQRVKIGIPEEKLLSASLLVYMFPILGLITGSLLASLLLPLFALDSEVWVILAGFSVAILVFYAVKNYLNGINHQHFCPQLLEVSQAAPPVINIKQV